MNTIDKCTKCGFCKSTCPTFKTVFDETISPRGFTAMIDENKLSLALYNCTLCKACTFTCPANIDLHHDFRKARQELVKKGIETPANKEMIAKIREFGNPFGKLEKGKKPKDLYCC